MKKLPIGMQTFRKLIKENYLYVDKTKDIYNLILQGSEYFFISRPRRFGKSLLVSTLKEVFSGNKDLFKGLWIYDKIEWGKYPVITIDFTKINYETPKKLAASLKRFLDDTAEDLGIELDVKKNYKESFFELIKELSAQGRVVVLIDEYDKPIIEFVDKKERAAENRDILKAFYEILKAADEYLKFVFITGVSKFSKVSLFSGLNNLNDITLDEQFSTMLGYTHEEVLHYFKDRLKNDRISDIKRWYNGYSWDGKNFLYNPLSILLYFDKGKFGNFWFSTGTPTFLIKYITENKIDVKRIENYETNKFLFDSFDIERINVFSLLFQTGYLTVKEIKDVSPTQSIYRLSYPNEEVRESFLQYLTAAFTGKYPDELGFLIYKLQESIAGADLDHFFEDFKSIFASVPYDIFIDDREAYYHTIVYLVLKLMGINIDVEVETNVGRIDAVFETDDYVFIMEFKVGEAAAALAQIRKNKYYEKYLPLSKRIKIIGVGFDMEQRNIGDYRVEDIPPG